MSINRLEIGSATDIGRVRTANEDALLVADLADGAFLVAVADGMGGHRAGEVASGMAIESFARTVQTRSDRSDAPSEALRQAIEEANEAVWEASLTEPGCEGMGTTLVGALVSSDGRAVVANVGDSRAYVVLGGEVRQVTDDHSWIAEQVRAGRLTERQAEVHPYRNVLSRSLGTQPGVQVDLFGDLALDAGDLLVLCSDGVSGYLSLADLATLAASAATAQQFADALVGLALERGGADNATTVVVRALA